MEIDALIVLLIRALGLIAALVAILHTRTAQGAVAWAVSLVSYPYVALPLYAIFGFDRFKGYVRARRIDDENLRNNLTALQHQSPTLIGGDPTKAKTGAFEKLAGLPFVRGNRTTLLIDGAATFDAIIAAIDASTVSVLVQFYIVRDDDLGQRLFTALIAAAHRGVTVCLLFDAIGSASLKRASLDRLLQAGVRCAPFRSTKGPRSRIQANFRNHRKNVIVDGRIAFIGGHNVGNEYLGLNPKLGRWRDTHVRIEGPAALEAQLVYVEDWYWSTGEIPRVPWQVPEPAPEGRDVLILASGPADPFDTCELMFAHAITGASRRVWISAPYFVPGPEMMSALQLAALRGVEVRIIVAGKSDNAFSDLASRTYLAEALRAGIAVDLFQDGFLHQKVFLVDDELAAVSTANFDRRSFGLNFEISALIWSKDFAGEVESMLREDLALSLPVHLEEVEKVPVHRQLAARAARLLTPIL